MGVRVAVAATISAITQSRIEAAAKSLSGLNELFALTRRSESVVFDAFVFFVVFVGSRRGHRASVIVLFQSVEGGSAEDVLILILLGLFFRHHQRRRRGQTSVLLLFVHSLVLSRVEGHESWAGHLHDATTRHRLARIAVFIAPFKVGMGLRHG